MMSTGNTSGGRSNRPRTYTSVACNLCKQSRKKCTGGQPCHYCTQRKAECVYAAADDGRTKGARKRKVQDIESDVELLHELLHTLQNSKHEQTANIFALISKGKTINEIKLNLKRQMTEDWLKAQQRSPGSERLIVQVGTSQATEASAPATTSAPSRGVLDIQRLTDDPPY